MTEENNTMTQVSEKEKVEQIESLKKTIQEAEKTIREAKMALNQLQGTTSSEEGSVVQGTFDGQIMIGDDRKQYPVPANYASKSKLVEGDRLKLTITPNGSFVYKQVGPAERKNIIGIASQDETGNFYILADGKAYKILLASITYFKVSPGDEVVIVTSRDIDSSWAAIENVLRKGDASQPITPQQENSDTNMMHGIELIDPDKEVEEESKKVQTPQEERSAGDTLIDSWISDIDDIREDLKKDLIEDKIQE